MRYDSGMSRSLASVAALVLLGLVPSCSGDAPQQGFFSRDVAAREAGAYVEAWRQGDVERLAAMMGEPFHFGTRTWKERRVFVPNLSSQVSRLGASAIGMERQEALSHGDLMRGSWPQERDVPEDRRASEAEKLGVTEDGFLVRFARPGTRGWLIVLNPGPASALVVTGLVP